MPIRSAGGAHSFQTQVPVQDGENTGAQEPKKNRPSEQAKGVQHPLALDCIGELRFHFADLFL